jgi:MmyB-like transcription regulator ligand binding domain
MLADVEREHLFLLGLGRPEVRYQKNEGVTPRLQCVPDALEQSPALIRTATWDVVAWNRASTVMLTDYGSLPPGQRNVLRFIFLDPRRGHREAAFLGDRDEIAKMAQLQALPHACEIWRPAYKVFFRHAMSA